MASEEEQNLTPKDGEAIEVINHYKRKIVRHMDTNKPEVLLHALNKLNKIRRISILILSETGIGKTVNSLKKCSNTDVSSLAKDLVVRWKEIVAAEESHEGGDESSSQSISTTSINKLEESDVKKRKHVASDDHNNNIVRTRDHNPQSKMKKHEQYPSSKNITSDHKSHNGFSESHHSVPNDDAFGVALNAPHNPSPTKRLLQPPPPTLSSLSVPTEPSFSGSGSALIPIPTLRTDYKPMTSSERQQSMRGLPGSSTSSDICLKNNGSNFSINKSRGRTAVYSGKKRTGYFGEVPKLMEMCVKVLQDHVDAIEECGGLDFVTLKPVLNRASPQTLMKIEEYNPYLMEDTGELWQKHVKKKFLKHSKQEYESWREMFERCSVEMESKFQKLQAKIKSSYKHVEKNTMKTKLAYVDSVAKPPRSVQRAQLKHGTNFPVGMSIRREGSSPSSVISGRDRPSVAPVLGTGGGAGGSSNKSKPKVAPMMAKTLRMIRGINGYKR